MDIPTITGRLGFVMIFLLLLALMINTVFINKCEESKTFMKKKYYWIPFVLGTFFGLLGVFLTSKSSQLLRAKLNREIANKAEAAAEAVARAKLAATNTAGGLR